MKNRQTVIEALGELVTPDALKAWLQTPNPALDNQTPNELIARQETKRLWRIVRLLQSGEPAE